MSEACLKAENSIPYVSHFEELCTLVKRPVSIVESCAMAAVRASLDLNASAVFVLSTSGESARLISKYRPVCPIIMITRNAPASRYGHLYRGVYPFLFPEAKPDFSKVNWQEDVDKRIKWGLSHAIDLGILNQGETVVVVQGWKVRRFLPSACNPLPFANSVSRAVWATRTPCALSRPTSTTLALASWINLGWSRIEVGVCLEATVSQERGSRKGPAIDLFGWYDMELAFLSLLLVLLQHLV